MVLTYFILEVYYTYPHLFFSQWAGNKDHSEDLDIPQTSTSASKQMCVIRGFKASPDL